MSALSEVRLSKETISALLWLIPAILLSTTGELFLKRGMNEIGAFDFASVSTLVPTVIKILSNLNIWIGIIGFGGGSLFWLSVISRVPLSFAYPMLGFSYVIVAFESAIFLGESVTWLHVAGALVVGVGVGLVGIAGAGK